MGFLDSIFGSKKEMNKDCSLKKKPVTISKENVLAQYRMTMFCYICHDSSIHSTEYCPEETCVYHIENASRADNAMEKKLSVSGLTNKQLYDKVAALSFEDYKDLIINYGRFANIKDYCK
jgi:hypothetical protein